MMSVALEGPEKPKAMNEDELAASPASRRGRDLSDQEIMRIAELVTHRHAFRINYLDIPKIVRAVLAKYADCRTKAEPVASIESLPYAQLLAGAAAVLSDCAEALQGEGDDCLEHEARSMAEMIDLELQKQQTLSEMDR